jgi:hypothetical protein
VGGGQESEYEQISVRGRECRRGARPRQYIAPLPRPLRTAQAGGDERAKSVDSEGWLREVVSRWMGSWE